MPSENLTARLVEGLKPGSSRLEYFDRRVPGLALRVSTVGGKSWVLLYRHHRRQRRWTIGRYPTLSLADARERAREGLRAAERGHDPAQAKQDAHDAETFEEVAARYITEYAEPRKRSWKDDRRLLRTEVLPHWRHRPVGEIR
ncbi:MAG: Arm DNA-binding domain-containing protein, partial [Vicinamibacterales bacterium]|nr:Arm DNA-binding domain-containing protein [Vicinamibacterales bacterium]